MIPRPKVPASSAVTRSNPARIFKKFSLLFASCLAVTLVPVVCVAQEPAASEVDPVVVLSFKWQKDRRAAELVDASHRPGSPAPAMIPQNKNFARQARNNEPPGARDPNLDTLDGRSAELDRITAEARETKPRVDGFTYEAKIQNNSTKVASRVFWEYQFKEKGNQAVFSRRQFVCLAKVKPEKTRDLEIFTLVGPTVVINVKTLSNKTSNPFDESVIINRVEFEDGTAWQRKEWNFDEVKYTALPASDAKKLQMCRGL